MLKINVYTILPGLEIYVEMKLRGNLLEPEQKMPSQQNTIALIWHVSCNVARI